ncbi:MAG: META domain-containing protein [Ignavibacteria bacterium]|nr:META domain-containing protein [Ignavibacteria bacterium]
MKPLYIILLLVTVIFAAGCSSSDSSSSNNKPLTGTEWVLYEIGGNKYEAAAGKDVTIKFDGTEQNVNGKAPCNTYGGPYIKSSNKLYFGGLYSTEMACDELKSEQEYFKILGKVFSYRISGDKLYFYDNVGLVIARFKAN